MPTLMGVLLCANSMAALIECVPNFSEGRDESIIQAITDAMTSVEGVTLLDVDMGSDFNRTVVTIVGPPEAVLESAILGTGVALDLIDMTTHTGEHDRMGAVDVVPFIPISGATMDECVDLSIRYGEVASQKFGLPIYLYAKSARTDERIRLPDIRRGQYEGLQSKLSDPSWHPDFGPPEFKPKMGVTATGARNILIAYNVNLDTNDKAIANIIAGKLRTSGVLMKDSDGQKIFGPDGKAKRIPGKFQSLQAAGWMYNEDIAQVSMNFLDYSLTGLHSVTEAIRTEAAELDLNITAGELIGLVPLNAMLDAGRYYDPSLDPSESKRIVDVAIDNLKLDILGPFEPNNRIIEWASESI